MCSLLPRAGEGLGMRVIQIGEMLDFSCCKAHQAIESNRYSTTLTPTLSRLRERGLKTKMTDLKQQKIMNIEKIS